MNILGIGGWEFAAILVIMLIVAGPRRMAHWAYILGKYTAKLRSMWSETMAVLQAEFDEAGVDVQLPKDLPTRANIRKTASDALKPLTSQVEEAMAEVESDVNVVKETAAMVNTNGQNTPKPKTNKPAELPRAEDTDKDNKPDFGTWSNSGKDEN